MAYFLGLAISTLSRWELGKGTPRLTFRQILKLEAALRQRKASLIGFIKTTTEESEQSRN